MDALVLSVEMANVEDKLATFVVPSVLCYPSKMGNYYVWFCGGAGGMGTIHLVYETKRSVMHAKFSKAASFDRVYLPMALFLYNDRPIMRWD